MPKFDPPEVDPPTNEQKRHAVYELVGYRKGRAMRVTDEALEDGLARGCLRWYYVNIPTGFTTENRVRKAVAFDRTLVIERKYTSREQGITTEWNAWCVRWGLPSMQVFTPAQKEERTQKGEPLFFQEEPDPETPRPLIEEPSHNPGAVGDPDEEVEQAIVAAADEYNLDLEAEVVAPTPTSAGCANCSAGPGEACDAECSCMPCAKTRIKESAAHLSYGGATPRSGAPRPAPAKPDKKFWEE